MRVLEGEVTANGESFGAGESFSSEALAARAVPLSPRPDTYFFAADGTAAVRFSWSALNYSGPTKFDLALDRRFRRLERSVASMDESLPFNLNPGVYWWRVYPEQSSGQPDGRLADGTVPDIPAGKIVVVPPAFPVLISPADGQGFYRTGFEQTGTGGTAAGIAEDGVETASARMEIRFLWKNGALPPTIQDTGDYVLELADSPVFEAPLLSFNVEGTDGGSIVYGGLGEGTWYWRVRQLFPGGELAAAPSRFVIASTRPTAESFPAAESITPESAAMPEPAIAAETAVASGSPGNVSRNVIRPQAPSAPPAIAAPPPVPPAPVLPLPAPSGMSPPDRFVAGPETIRRSRQMVFSWDGVEGANSYVFSLFEESVPDAGIRGSGGIRNSGVNRTGNSSLILRTETAETSYTLEDIGFLARASGGNGNSAGAHGTFVWQVEAIRKNGNLIERRGTPGEGRFTLDVPAPGNPQVRETGELYGL
jgi:hypothetical protein